MNIDEFWNVIENGKSSDEPEILVKEVLKQLSPDDLISYQEHFDILFENAYQWTLWGAAYIIGGGCSDDGFTDFRYGLISKGKRIFEEVLDNPDSLSTLGEDTEIGNELFGYLALEVYEETIGKEIPRKEFTGSSEPSGEEWNFDDEKENTRRLPKITKIFG